MSYSKGYDQGFNDGKSGKSKTNVNNFVKGLTSLSVEQYLKGYEEGYRKGCEVRNLNK